jgi:hypothetical protein
MVFIHPAGNRFPHEAAFHALGKKVILPAPKVISASVSASFFLGQRIRNPTLSGSVWPFGLQPNYPINQSSNYRAVRRW